MPRKYTIVHEQYLTEWLMKNYPLGSWSTNVRLGVPSPKLVEATVTPEERRALKIWTAQADAIVTLPDKVIIVEALVRPEWWKIQQLKMYGKLFKSTPEFKEHWHKPLELLLLTTVDSPFHAKMAEMEGIRYVLYQPEWIIPYIQRYGVRRRRPPLAYVTPPE